MASSPLVSNSSLPPLLWFAPSVSVTLYTLLLLSFSSPAYSVLPSSVPFHLAASVLTVALFAVLSLSSLAEKHEGKDLPQSMSPPTLAAVEASSPSSPTSDTHVWREQQGRSVWVQKYWPSKSRSDGSKFRTDITMAEVSSHSTISDCWIVIESRAYDITTYVRSHPGGWLPLQNMAGKDCTDVFSNYHPASVYQRLLPSYYVGDVTDSLDKHPFTVEHREIRQELLRRGLFETNSNYYYLKIYCWLLPLFLSAVSLTYFGTTLALRLLGGCLMAGFWQQLAFVGHDVGHNAVSHKKAKDTFLGVLFGNSLGGISLGWWKRSHNVHHIVCNSVENDPDIQHMPMFAVTDGIFDERKLREAGVLDEKSGGFW